VNPSPPSSEGSPPALRDDDSIEKRVKALSSWMRHIDLQLRATATAVDEKALKELRKTIEALSKRDPRFEDRVTNRVDVVADRLASLAKTVSTTATTLAAKDGEIAGLRRELREGNARTDAVMAELRRTLDAARVEAPTHAGPAPSREKKPKGGDRQLGALAEKVDVLAQRLDTMAGTVNATAAGMAGREGELAALRRKLEDETARIEAAIAELRRSTDPVPMLELRENVKTLSESTSALKRSTRRGLDEVTNRVTALAGHVDVLARAATSAVDGVAEGKSETADLRSTFDEETARLDNLVVKLHQGIGTLTSQVGALERGADRAAVEALDDRVKGLGDALDALADRVDALGSSLDVTARQHDERAAETAALARRFEEASSRVDALVDDLRTALETMPEPGPDPDLGSRLDAVAQSVAELARDLERREAAASASSDELRSWTHGQIESLTGRLDAVAASGIDQLEAGIAALRASSEAEDARLDAIVATLQDAVAAVSAQVEALERPADGEAGAALGDRLSALDATIAAVVGRVDELDSAVDAAARDYGDKQVEVVALTRRFEEAGSRVDVLVGDLREALDTMPGSRLDADADARLAELAESVGALADRLGRMETATVRPGHEARQLLAAAATRLDAIEARLGRVESAAPPAMSERPPSEAEIDRLRALVDGLTKRMASSERELATLASSRNVADSLDDLTRRLDLLEYGGLAAAAPEPPAPVPGDGRFRLELRALELRMEHAEAAARENREAVLLQLERLASRIEWRFRELEGGDVEAAVREAGGSGALGKVVPIRSNDD
jgi:chromosome segregation ATPase